MADFEGTGGTDVLTAPPRRTLSRRAVIGAAAWSVPLIALGTATPAFAASGALSTGYPWSSWGGTWGSQQCKVSKNGNSVNTYTWNIDNTEDGGADAYGVRFYATKTTDLYGTYSGLVNVYFLPFNSGQVTGNGAAGWTTLSYSATNDNTYGTLIGPSGAKYYAWVTQYSPSYTVDATHGKIHGPTWIGNKQYYWIGIPNNYAFKVAGSTTNALPAMYASHEYFALLNGVKIVNSTPVNGNFPGRSTDFSNWTSNGDASSGWRNNGWVAIPGAQGTCKPIGGGSGNCYPCWNPGWGNYKNGDCVTWNGCNYRYGNGGWSFLGQCPPDCNPQKPSQNPCGDWSSQKTYQYCDTVSYNNKQWECNVASCYQVKPGSSDDTARGVWTCLSGQGLRKMGSAFVADGAAPTSSTSTETATAGTTTVTTTASPTTSPTPTDTTTSTTADATDTVTTTSTAATTTTDAEALKPTFVESLTPMPVPTDPPATDDLSGGSTGSFLSGMGIQSFALPQVPTDTATDSGSVTPVPC